jgi:biotin transport system substrate-specific component
MKYRIWDLLYVKDFSFISELSIFQKILLIIFFNVILILFSQIKLYLPFLPVPFTLQTLAILLIGGVLGYKYGVLVVILYILQGILGLPVFANFSNFSSVIGSYSLGYIIGFIPATFIFGLFISYFIKHNKINFINVFLAGFISILLAFLFGLMWIFYLTKNIFITLFYGLYPFVFTDIIKIIVASLVINKLYKNKQ